MGALILGHVAVGECFSLAIGYAVLLFDKDIAFNSSCNRGKGGCHGKFLGGAISTIAKLFFIAICFRY